MRRNTVSGAWRSALILGSALALVGAACILPAAAERPAKSVLPEKAVGGMTVAELAARQAKLHAELAPRVPAGVANAPVFVDIDQSDKDALAAPYDPGREPMRIGAVKSLNRLVGKPAGGDFSGGVLDEKPDGSFVWAVSVSSADAQAIRLHITDLALPPNTELYLLGANGQADGPYTGRGRSGDGDLWTRSIAGETGTLVLKYGGSTPAVDLPRMSLVVSDVGHIRGRPPRPLEKSHDSWPCSDNAPCLVDVNCTSTGPAAPAENAVAKMEWIKGAFVYTCSGGLIADTDTGTQIPYFLTANHCFSSSISNLETWFFYTTDSCNGSCPDSLVTGGTVPPASTVGITVVASGRAGDYTLGTLNEAPPAGVTFLGWSNAPVAFTSGASLYRVSNANYGPQVYSQHSVDTVTSTCTGWPRGERIYSVDVVGATMGGSSGSPVVNSAGQVVGQLSGCCGFNCANECDSANNWTVDGALAFYYDNVAAFLDPAGGGCTSDAQCDDGQYCNGTESCVSGMCQSSGNPCAGGTICNETSDTCETPICDSDGVCEPGEDCNNCPADCASMTGGPPSGRYCCDGDVAGCGDARCDQNGFTCGSGGGMCTSDPECDDGLFCTGAETCSGGSCQSSGNPCGAGTTCNEGTDTCTTCGGNKASCSVNGDCCSGNCRNGSCKGN